MSLHGENVDQTAFSLYDYLLGKSSSRTAGSIFSKYLYKPVASLTCYMKMSVPGAVNVKISKKDTADSEKIVTKQIGITIH